MAYIYKITNDINDKIYIGKTTSDLNTRFRQHCFDSTRECCKNRPLYRAMNKYGIEHFTISLIEECNNPEEREKFWITYFNSYGSGGYNATIGGDGRPYINYDEIYNLYQKGFNCSEIAEQTNYDAHWISTILKNIYNISAEEIAKMTNRDTKKEVKQYSKDGKYIATYESIRAAARAMIDLKLTNCKEGTAASHISEVIRNKRKTFANFIWL